MLLSLDSSLFLSGLIFTANASVNQLFAEWDRPDSPGVALSVVRDGDVIYKRGYGIANLEHDVPITPATVFDIASVSKQFAGMAVAMLIDQGEISLDDDIRKYLPEAPDFGKTVTVRHLVHHISGIRDWVQSLAIAGWRMDDVITFDHILRMFWHQKELNHDPGDEYIYSNTNYNLLVEIVMRLSGQTFSEYAEANIFRPLGMMNTHFLDDHEMILKNRACSYRKDENGGFKICVDNLMAIGSSSLHSTVEDLAKWLINFDQKRVGGPAVIEQMHQQGILNSGEKISYAFGLNVEEYRGLKNVNHGGGWAGFRTHTIHFPEQKFGVVILCNLAHVDPARLARQVAGIYLADEMAPDTPKAAAKKVEAEKQQPDLEEIDLEQFVGDYYCDELAATYTIVLENDRLVAKHWRHGDIVLKRAGDHFTGEKWFISEIRFQRDEENRVSGFRLTGGRVRNLRFDKQVCQ